MNINNSINISLNQAINSEKGLIKVSKVKLSIAAIPNFSASEIKRLRNEMGMTQVCFAAVMGVSPKTVEAWESGKNTPDGAAQRILSILMIDPQLPYKYKIVIA